MAALLQAALFVVLARSLGPKDFGDFASFYAAAGFVAALAAAGGSPQLLRIGRSGESGLIGSLALLRGVTLVLIVAGVAVIGTETVDVRLALAGALLAASDAGADFFQALFAGRGSQSLSIAVILTQRVMTTLWPALALVSGLDASVSLIIASSILCVITGAALFRLGLVARRPMRVLWASRGFWFAAFASNIRLLEVPAVAAVASSGTAGSFAFVSRFMNPLLIVPSSLQSIYVPKLSVAQHDFVLFQRQFAQAWKIAACYATLVILCSVPAGYLLSLAAGKSFLNVQELTYVFFGVGAVASMVNVYQIGLYSVSRPVPVGVGIGAGGLSSLILIVSLFRITDGAVIYLAPFVGQFVQLVVLRGAFNQSKRFMENRNEFLDD